MIRRWLGKSLLVLMVVALPAAAQEMTTDAERSWRELRNSRDVKRKLMAERWHNVVRQQDWSDATGKFKTSAKYVAHDPQLTWVKLRVIQGAGEKRVVKDVQIPLEKLNNTCQARVRQIAKLSEKIAAAVEAEKKADDEDKEGTPAEGDEMVADSRGEGAETRGESAEVDAGLAGMDAEQVTAEADPQSPPDPRTVASTAAAPPVTNDGPPLPALIPKLPPSQSATPPAVPAEQPEGPSAEAPADESAPAGPTAFKHPTTPEELQAVFTEAFKSGDKATLETLIYWDDTPEDLRKQTYANVIDPAGSVELLGITIEDRTADAAFIDHTLDSTTCFQIEYETKTSGVVISWPFAEVDGKFYLGAWNPDESAVSRR